MSFDHQAFQHDLIEHLKNRLGWDTERSKRVSIIASDVICLTHGGQRHYIKSRNTDKKAIRDEFAAGKTISELARSNGLSAKTIRTMVR